MVILVPITYIHMRKIHIKYFPQMSAILDFLVSDYYFQGDPSPLHKHCRPQDKRYLANYKSSFLSLLAIQASR